MSLSREVLGGNVLVVVAAEAAELVEVYAAVDPLDDEGAVVLLTLDD